MKYSCVPGLSVAIVHIVRAAYDCALPKQPDGGMPWKRGSKRKEGKKGLWLPQPL